VTKLESIRVENKYFKCQSLVNTCKVSFKLKLWLRLKDYNLNQMTLTIMWMVWIERIAIAKITKANYV